MKFSKYKEAFSLFISAAISVLVILLVISPYVNKYTIFGNERTISDGHDVFRPKFMYFMTKSDNEETKHTIERLKEEYASVVDFDIKYTDSDKSLLEEYPIKDNTPALIMMDEKGDVSSIMFKTSEYEKLKSAIDVVLSDN